MGPLGACVRPSWYKEKGKPMGGLTPRSGSFVHWECSFMLLQILRALMQVEVHLQPRIQNKKFRMICFLLAYVGREFND